MAEAHWKVVNVYSVLMCVYEVLDLLRSGRAGGGSPFLGSLAKKEMMKVMILMLVLESEM